MRLERDTTNYPSQGYHYQDSNEYEGDVEDIYAKFSRFGGQNSEFKVHLNWSDVERAIEKFAALEHPYALRLLKAREIAEGIKTYLSPEPPSQSN